MRRIIHKCIPEWDQCDLYIFTGLDLYDLKDMYDLQDLYVLQDLYDLPEWNLGDLNDSYILTRMRSVRFAGSVWSGGSVEAGYLHLFQAVY